MGYVRYVGRIGALAVALGVGSAVATMPGVALAEPSDSSSSSSDSSSSPGSSSTDNDSPSGLSSSSSSASTSPSASNSPSSTTISSPSSMEADSSSSAESSATPDPPTAVVQGTGGAQTSSTASTITNDQANPSSTPVEPPPKADVDGAVKTSSRSAALTASTSSIPQGNSTGSASTPQSPSVFRLTNTTSSPVLRTVTVAAPATGSAPMALAATSTETVTPQAAPPAFSGPLAPLNIVTGVVSTLLGWAGLGPSMTASPVAPVQEPMLWTLLAWVRREIEQTLLNLTPAAGAQHVNALIVASPNLLVNPGAELGDPSLSGYSSVTVPGWTVTGTPTVIEYGTLRRFPWPTASPGPTFPAFLGFPSANCAPPDSGEQFFGGGPVATSTLIQNVDLRPAASDIDA